MSTELTKEKRIWFEKIKKNNVLHHQINLLEEICTNKNVLDVGCVGQAVNYENPDWVHNKIRNVSNKIVGVDINHEGIEKLKKRGYDIFHYNQLNKDERFDVIIILDVIEHVNDPVEFMNIYQRFLQDDGVIVITTPNSNRAKNFVNILFCNDYPLNYEHTFSFCPKMFIETIKRTTSLKIRSFYWLNYYNDIGGINLKKRILITIDKFLIKFRSNFSPNFMFILESKENNI